MQQRIIRRTSFGGSTPSLRRSSVSAKDIQAIQAALAKQQPSESLILCMVVVVPLLSFFYLFLIHQHHGSLPELSIRRPIQCNYHIRILFGVELHPTILDIDVKHFVRSRITFVIWPLFIISSIYYQRNMQGKITRSLMGCSLVQLLYILKYHWTEYLAFNSLEYKRWNCGIYKLWRDMVLFPVLYCSSISIIAQSQKSISLITSLGLTAIALFFICITFVIDKQKYDFRRSKGNMKIGGLDPFFIAAKYKNERGETSANLLLGSGYWSKSRHPNYVCEAATFLTFSAFQGLSAPIVCHVPAIFITGFLLNRVWLDESRCLAKYGQSWMQYCNKVPFRIFPGFIDFFTVNIC
ncbi:hypothetical protein KIN20_006045 [Parelaphostrongylus tenuis]|uniref:7-dehydrocholesterol reductase n=1 Tax=Parelaphostrongylus tenuis TaxID=148309 RepID=A0AAD5M320_PARTN|nr:hypothetical protein KIN20_006045 [Parelaphostrongylus tenuis]